MNTKQVGVSNEGMNFSNMLDEFFNETESLDGKVVDGTIVGLKNDKAIVDVGLKAEGKIAIDAIKTVNGPDSVFIGAKIKVFVERFEDRNGEPILSVEKAKKEATWIRLEKCMESGTIIEGIIVGRMRGGFAVDIDGTTAFLPGSQVDLRMNKDISPLMNIIQPFKILKMDKLRNNIVISRRAVLEAERVEIKKQVMEKLEEGMEIDGTVKNLTEYGAFVDIGGIDGLLHITDMSWKRVCNPAEFVNIGDKVKVQVLKFNQATGRISLGMKQLTQSPWENIEQKYVIGNKYKGKIVNVTEYGAFVELEDCIEGMIYMTELSWTKKNVHPSKILTIGSEVEVMVLDVNPAKRKIALGLKQCMENPWLKFAEEHPNGTKLSGVVKNVTEFGIFVAVNEELDGMIHLSDLSWKAGNNEDKYKNIRRDQVVEVVVLDVNFEKERISLGIKQLEDDPYAIAVSNTKKGDVVFAKVTNVQMSGLDVKLENGLIGFIKKGEVSNDKFTQKTDVFTEGEEIEAIVLGIDRSRSVNLSIRILEAQREKEALKKFGDSGESNTSIGNIIEAAISAKEEEKNNQ